MESGPRSSAHLEAATDLTLHHMYLHAPTKTSPLSHQSWPPANFAAIFCQYSANSWPLVITFVADSTSPPSDQAKAPTPEDKSVGQMDDEHAFGLKPLIPGENPLVKWALPLLEWTWCLILGLSIIAVHGLNGHQEETWTASNGIMWLQQLLPAEIPRARILTYGYDSRTHSSEVLTHQTLYGHSMSFVAALSLYRRRTKVRTAQLRASAHGGRRNWS